MCNLKKIFYPHFEPSNFHFCLKKSQQFEMFFVGEGPKFPRMFSTIAITFILIAKKNPQRRQALLYNIISYLTQIDSHYFMDLLSTTYPMKIFDDSFIKSFKRMWQNIKYTVYSIMYINKKNLLWESRMGEPEFRLQILYVKNIWCKL